MDQTIRFLHHRLSWRTSSLHLARSLQQTMMWISHQTTKTGLHGFLTQIELNDLVRDLGLSKEKSEYWGQD
jgi:hypothetical protein